MCAGKYISYNALRSFINCAIKLSLEILRRSYVQTEGYQDIKGLYRVALKTKQLDVRLPILSLVHSL